LRNIGKTLGEGGHWKGLHKLILKIIIKIFKKKDIMGAKNINVLIGENKISYSKMNENENNILNNLYDHGLPIFW
jgi:deoxyhypusine synthase